jgi:hypothetical protein
MAPRLSASQTMRVSLSISLCISGLAHSYSILETDSILVIDVPKQRVYLVGDGSILKSGTHRVPRDGRYKYLGGALTSDGQYAYLFPW